MKRLCLTLMVLGGCGGDSGDECAPFVFDPAMDRCTCPPGTVERADRAGCDLSDGGTLLFPDAEVDSACFGQPSGTACGDSGGICRDGLCTASACGDGVLDVRTESCDDGADGDDSDGCTDDCAFSCEDSSQCDDGDVCNGAERCDPATHACVLGDALDCNDGDNCTEDSCDSVMGCRRRLIDEDGDGFAPESLGTCATMVGSSFDCDDGDAGIYPGAPEQCDSISHDCDARIDEDIASVICFRDADEDGYGDDTDRQTLCACPDGYIPTRPDGLVDCADDFPQVNPAQTEFFEMGYLTEGGISFDYNCDGEQELGSGDVREPGESCGYNPIIGACLPLLGIGWNDGTAPTCGATEQWAYCGGAPSNCDEHELRPVTQTCR